MGRRRWPVGGMLRRPRRLGAEPCAYLLRFCPCSRHSHLSPRDTIPMEGDLRSLRGDDGCTRRTCHGRFELGFIYPKVFLMAFISSPPHHAAPYSPDAYRRTTW